MVTMPPSAIWRLIAAATAVRRFHSGGSKASMPRLTPSTAGSSPTIAALSEVKRPARAVFSNQVLVDTTAPSRYMPHSVAFSSPNRNCGD